MNKQYQVTIHTRPYEREIVAENAKQVENMVFQSFGDDVYKIDIKLQCSVCDCLYDEADIRTNEYGEMMCEQCYTDQLESEE